MQYSPFIYRKEDGIKRQHAPFWRMEGCQQECEDA